MSQRGGKANLNINIPVSLAEKVSKEAKRTHKTKTQVVREILEERYAPKMRPKSLDVEFYEGLEEEINVNTDSGEKE